MKRLIVCYLLLLVSCGTNDEPEAVTKTYPKEVLVLGDSITTHGGYVKELCKAMTNTTFTVIAKSGNTSRQVRKDFDMCDLVKYDDIIILCGINNIYEFGQVQDDLGYMYAKAKQSGLRVIAITLTPWKAYDKWTDKLQYNTDMINGWIDNQDNVDIVVDAYRLLSERSNLGYLDSHWSSKDGLHLNNEGQRSLGIIISLLVYPKKFNYNTYRMEGFTYD